MNSSRSPLSPLPSRSGKGMPITKQPGSYGNLMVHFEVRFPRELSDAAKQQLREVLPPN